MKRPARWLLAAAAILAAGTLAATSLTGCTECPNPPPDACVPGENLTREEACARCGGIYHGCNGGQWVPFSCTGGPLPGRG